MLSSLTEVAASHTLGIAASVYVQYPAPSYSTQNGQHALSAEATILYVPYRKLRSYTERPGGPFGSFGFRNLSLRGDEMRERASGATRPHSAM